MFPLHKNIIVVIVQNNYSTYKVLPVLFFGNLLWYKCDDARQCEKKKVSNVVHTYDTIDWLHRDNTC